MSLTFLRRTPAAPVIGLAAAALLAPVVAGGDFRGTISVHLMDRTRRWSPEDVGALCEARRELESALAGGPET